MWQAHLIPPLTASQQATPLSCLLLSIASPFVLQTWGAPRPGGLLVCGPAGSGKSALLASAAAALRQHPECLTYTVTVSCRDISAESAGQAQAQIMPKARRGAHRVGQRDQERRVLRKQGGPTVFSAGHGQQLVSMP